ncbi:MAG: hypothetical protein K6G10_01455 [Butyrivibrio sp.]|nr:hypothetical protein [Butyrivibrio sp.]
MSHNICHFDYKEKVNRKSVQAELDHYAAMEDWQEGCTGLLQDIRWLDDREICESYDEAYYLINKLDRSDYDQGDYDQLAVRYYVTPPVKNSSETKKAADARANAYNNYSALKEKVCSDFFNTKSEYIGCKECGSKLSKKYLKEPKCPLCGRNLLSDTAMQRLMNAHDKFVNAQKKEREEVKKAEQKAIKKAKNREVRWLVKIEYHT